MLTHNITVTNGLHTMQVSFRLPKFDEIYARCCAADGAHSVAYTAEYFAAAQQRISKLRQYNGFTVVDDDIEVVTWA